MNIYRGCIVSSSKNADTVYVVTEIEKDTLVVVSLSGLYQHTMRKDLVVPPHRILNDEEENNFLKVYTNLMTEHNTPNTTSNKSDGSTADYYQLPQGATQLQDLISHRNMNAQLGEIFRACYRFGMASHSDQLRDAKKIKFYIDAEIKRLEGK